MRLRAFAIVFVLLTLTGSLWAIDPQLVGLAMPGARVLAGMNVTQVRTTPFGQYLLSRIPTADPNFQEFVSTTGFDPTSDITEVLASSAGQPGSKTGLVAVLGHFDTAKILSAVQAKGAAVTSYNGVQMINNPEKTGAVAFLSSSLAVAGDAASVMGAIDRKSSPGALDTNLLTKANQVSAAQDAWVVSIVPASEFAKVGAGQGPAGVNLSALQTISQMSGGVKFGAGAQVSAEVVAGTAQDANALGDVVRLLTSMAQMNQSAPNAPQIQAVVQSLVVSTVGNVVKLMVTIPEDLLEQAAQPHGAARAPRQRH